MRERERRIREVEAECRNADIMHEIRLDDARFVVEECDQFRKRQSFPGFGVYPVLLSSVIGQ